IHKFCSSNGSLFIRKIDKFTFKTIHSYPEEFNIYLEEKDFELFTNGESVNIADEGSFGLPNGYKFVVIPISTIEIIGGFCIFINNNLLNEDYLEILENIRISINNRLKILSLSEEVNKKSHQFNTIMETIPNSILYFEENGKFVWLNSLAKKMLNIPEEIDKPEIISQAMNSFRNKANNREEILQTAIQLFGNKDVSIKDWYWLFGNPINLVYKVFVLSTTYQNTKGQVWVFENFTSNYLADEKLKKLNEEIKEKITTAENANNAKSEFLANMSHELRTPLNSIIGFSQLILQSGDINKTEKEHVEFIYRSGNHLLSLINDILDLSKIEAGKYELYYTNFSLPSLILTISKMIEIKAIEKGLAYEVAQSPEIPKFIKFDEQKLKQVLLNLLSNAVKYTDKGDVLFSISSSDGKGSKDKKVKFSIKDTGREIPQEFINDIFIPFQQLTSTKKFIQGTGLGLSITKSFVEMMGSQINVQSEFGKGSVFSFEIEVEEVESHIEEGINLEEVIGYNGDRKKALIVDDNLVNRILLQKSLRKLGFDLTEAITGEDALEKIGEFHPDIVFMDLRMPGMGGIEAISTIRKNGNYDNIKLVATSASAFNETRNKCIEVGADDFLPKPIQYSELISKLTTCLKLDWITKEKKGGQIDKKEQAPDYKKIIESGLLNQLLNSSKKGDISKIEEDLTTLKTKFPEYTNLWARYDKFINHFEINLLIENLNNLLGEKK
ncbi:MAG: response regulator, partial [Leptospiraceae bacterium]|nr:response regulator [Leptospiraceae bacterium]